MLEQLDDLYRLARHVARDQAEADDLVQETLLRAFRAEDRYRAGGAGIRPWLCRILMNLLRNRRRDLRRERPLADERASEVVAAREPDVVVSRDGACGIDWERTDEALRDAVAALPVELREAFLLFALQGLKYREIADALQVPIGTVMSRLARARQRLAARIAASRGGAATDRRAEGNKTTGLRVG